MTPASLRTMSAVGAACAGLVVLGHLAGVWNGADGFEERRRIAFDHGIALAVILAVTLWLARVARWMEHAGGSPIGDAIAISGSIAVLLDLAWVWRDGMSDALQVTVEHVAALMVVALLAVLGSRLDRKLSSDSNRLNSAPIQRP
jgi:hypothetical protein